MLSYHKKKRNEIALIWQLLVKPQLAHNLMFSLDSQIIYFITAKAFAMCQDFSYMISFNFHYTHVRQVL